MLLVSFNSDYYLSDAEQDLQKQNRRTPEDYRNYLRRSLDNKISGILGKTIPCFSLMADTAAVETMWDFYNHSALKYTMPYGFKRQAEKTTLKKSNNKLADANTAHNYSTIHGDMKVMDNTIDSSFVRRIAAKYECDLILSINQFEIKTNYNSCMDIANGIYRREVQVHYTLMTASGKRLQGNVALAAFPSNDNRVEDIAEKVFPEIANYIATQVQSQLK